VVVYFAPVAAWTLSVLVASLLQADRYIILRTLLAVSAILSRINRPRRNFGPTGNRGNLARWANHPIIVPRHFSPHSTAHACSIPHEPRHSIDHYWRSRPRYIYTSVASQHTSYVEQRWRHSPLPSQDLQHVA
jgi:hypothetical protein